MDLNYLFHRHQVALMMARAARCLEARVAHLRMARGYADSIARLQSASGAHATPLAA